jgi:hypothetical protein
MAILNFPTSPSLNDTYSFNGKTWVWNGQGWQLQNQGAINGLVIGNSSPAAGTFTTLSATGNITTTSTIVGGNGYFTGNIDVLGNINSTNAVVYGNSATFLGDPVSGNNAAYFGAAGYTYLGSNIVIQSTGNANNYSQINFQNINPGTAASTDLVLTADNGNDTVNFLDLGIGGSNYAYEGYGAYYPNDGYLLTIGGNLLLNVTEPTKALRVAVGGTEESDLIMLVDTDGVSVTGNVAVSKNINVTGNLTVQGNLQYVNVEDLQIQDPVILIGGGANGDPLTVNDNQDRGSFLAYYTTGRGNAFVGWKNTTGNMIIASDVAFSANNVIQVNNYGTLQTGKIYNGIANADLGNVNTTRIHSVSGYFSGNVDVVGNLNATVGLVYANSGIFLGDAVTGNGAAYAGVPDFTTLGSNVVMQFGGNVNSYSQINFQNINSGTEASTDYILTADNGDDSSNYIDLGIGSSTYAAAAFPAYGPNDGYLLLSGGNLLLNTANTGSVIKFLVGGSDTTDVIATISNTQLGVTGSVSATGNIAGNYFIGNGSLLTGITGGGGGGITWTTVANTAPSSPNAGDFWYNSYTGVKYQYTNDGTGNVWIDQSFPTSFASLTTGTLSASSNITAGNLSVSTGTVTVGNIVNANANGVGNIGSSTTYFNTAFVKATSAQYADLAEYYKSDADYKPGTVVVFGGDEEITISNKSHDTRVAGVVSTQPAYIMNSQCEGLPVALTGRVPCQVQGPVDKGDVLVTGAVPGIAQRIGMEYQPGCVLGKSLETITDNSISVIEVVVGRF